METTVAKAKKMSGTAWKGGFLILIHAGVNLFACPGTQCAARRAASFVRGDDVLHKDRAGRCTRLLRTRIQVGDAAPMAYMELLRMRRFIFCIKKVTCFKTGLLTEK
ncbi:uncharacterized protein [Phaseolus vulgaris]|uniref:uncharacterized protein isoform X3 n=1 Tax=Phaseolus vulgaris TaxID=3885 RepID=UPI0035CB0C76